MREGGLGWWRGEEGAWRALAIAYRPPWPYSAYSGSRVAGIWPPNTGLYTILKIQVSNHCRKKTANTNLYETPAIHATSKLHQIPASHKFKANTGFSRHQQIQGIGNTGNTGREWCRHRGGPGSVSLPGSRGQQTRKTTGLWVLYSFEHVFLGQYLGI